MKFNEDLAAIHAYLCGDGYLTKPDKWKCYAIGLRNTNLILLKDFQNRFRKVFRVKAIIQKDGRCVKNSKEIHQRLINSFGSFHSYEWKMPFLNKKLSRIWLRAFFDCEGWVVCKTHQNRHIGLDSVNQKGLTQVKITLKKLNIKSKLKKRDDRNIFSLHIYGKENLVKFKKEIGFLHPSKKGKLKIAVNDFVNYYLNFPTEIFKLKKFIRNLLKKKGKIKKGTWIMRVISNKEKNLLKLQKRLNNLFDIESRVNKRKNGIGTIYFELNINKKEEIKKIIKNNLINKEEKEKWLKSRR